MRKSANFQLAIREQQGSQPHTHTHTILQSTVSAVTRLQSRSSD